MRAVFTGIWVHSFEHGNAIMEIARLCRQERWSLATWDRGRGPSIVGQDEATSARSPGSNQALGSLAMLDGTALLVLRNFHRFLGSLEIIQALDTAITAGKQNRAIVVILSPVVHLATELERQFVAIEHELPEGDDFAAVLDAASGLTRVEAENALSLSLNRHGSITPDVL